MRFKDKLQTLKFSIRLSIISLFLLLLSFVGFSIIGISYFTINKILRTSAINLIEQTSLQIKDRIRIYLMPLDRDLMQIQTLLSTNVLSPEEKDFDIFLADFIRSNTQIYWISYGKTNGDFYAVGRNDNKPVIYNIVNSHKPPLKFRYDLLANGDSTKKTPLDIDFDPRTRPWYKKVVETNSPSLTGIYTFTNFDTRNLTLVNGVTAAFPIYDKDKQLQGVVGMNLTLSHIQEFISQLKITKNSLVYIRDKSKNIIAYRNLADESSSQTKPLIPLSAVKIYKEGTVFSFKYKNENFFLVHQAIPGPNGKVSWYVTIIVPEKDILAPLRSVSINALLLTLVVLLLGTLLAHYISQKISNPIRFVANESKEIRNLNLKLRPLIKTRIKEISYLDESLINMSLSLLSFQRYVPSSIVRKLIISGEIAKVGGQSQEITVLFSDIKDFTSLAEASTPKQLMTFLSRYFQSMTESVLKYQGTLDKYIGDAIMAIWNAPFADSDHALHACQAAVDMIKRVEELNKINHELSFKTLHIRIGIDTGEAIVGNVGSEDRLSYTALGDTVNLANRIEELNKFYGTKIIVGKSTFLQASNQFPFRLLDEVAVRGKKQSTAIYELILEENLTGLDLHRKQFLKAFKLYQSGQWKESLELFINLTPAYPDDLLGKLYIERCKSLISNPKKDWDGIWRV